MKECRDCGCQHFDLFSQEKIGDQLKVRRICRNCGRILSERIRKKSKPRKRGNRIDDAVEEF